MSKKKKKSEQGIVKKSGGATAAAKTHDGIAKTTADTINPSKNTSAAEQHAPSRAFTSQRLIASALFMIALGLLTMVSIFVWGALGTAKSIAAYLPRTTLAFAEINTNLDSSDWKEIKRAFPNLNPEKKLAEILQTFFSGNSQNPQGNPQNNSQNNSQNDPQKDIIPWLSRNAGVAALKSGEWIGFLEVKNQESALNFFRNRTLRGMTDTLKTTDYKGETLYAYTASSGSIILFLGNYLIIAPNESAAHAIVDVAQNPDMQLKTDPAFLAARQSIPRSLLGDVFVAAPLAIPSLEPAPPPSSPSSASATEPPSLSIFSLDTLKKTLLPALGKIISSEIIGIKPWNGMIAVEHTAMLSDEAKKTGKNMRPAKKYRASLMEFFAKDTGLFLGGHGVTELIDKIQTWQKIDGFLAEQVRSAFDGRVTLQEMKELLRSEYAIGNDGGWKMVMKLDDPEAQKNILKKLLLGMQSSRMILAAQRTALNELNDATPGAAPNASVSAPLTGIAKDLALEQKKYRDITYNALQTTGDDTGMFIAVLDGNAIITLSEKEMKDTMDLWTESRAHFGQTNREKKIFAELLIAGDDLFYIDKKYAAIDTNAANSTNNTWRAYLPDALSQVLAIGQRIIVSSNAFESGIKTIVLIAP